MEWTWYGELAADIDRNLEAYIEAVNEQVRSEVPDLFADSDRQRLARASSGGLIAAFAEHLRHRLSSRFHAPPAAIAFARHLAHAGVPLATLLRAYRIGQAALFQRGVELIREYGETGADGAIAELAAVMFRLNDEAMVDVTQEFERERQALLTDVITRRVALVGELLAGRPVDLPSAETTLGYRLDGLHLGCVAWSEVAVPVEALQRAMDDVLDVFGAHDRLVVPHAEFELLAWGHVSVAPTAEQMAMARARLRGEVRIAIGDPGRDLAGFGQSGRQARRARAVAALRPDERLVCYHQVGLACLLLADLDAARVFAHAELGTLADRDSLDGDLRRTLETYLSVGQDQTATAHALGVHRNTVIRRLAQIQEALPFPIAGRWRQLAAALTICAWIDLDEADDAQRARSQAAISR